MPTRSVRHALLASAVVLFLVSACGGSSATPGATFSGGGSGATASLNVMSNGLGGDATISAIFCQMPTTEGVGITVLGNMPTTGNDLNLTIVNNMVILTAGIGSGPGLVFREFQGPTSTFDANKGATFDTTVTEIPQAGVPTFAPNATTGPIGTIKGSVDCGTQQAGTASMTVTGTVPQGALSGSLTPAKVTCVNSQSLGQNVIVAGIQQAGSTPTQLIVTATSQGFTVASTPQGGDVFTATLLFRSSDPSTVVFTGSGVTIQGDAQAVSSASNSVLHVTGSATCGTNATTP